MALIGKYLEIANKSGAAEFGPGWRGDAAGEKSRRYSGRVS